jgi:murein DD-endopeptidase MepM/ murein hydrolase activator NlpD
MELRGLITRTRQKLYDDSHWLTHRKLGVFGLTLILTGILLGLFESQHGLEPLAQWDTIKLPIPERTPAGNVLPADGHEFVNRSSPYSDTEWDSITVRQGQTLDAIFRQQGYSINLLHQILSLNTETRGLTNIRPGDIFEFRSEPDGEFRQMRYALDDSRYLVVQQEGGSLSAEIQPRDVFAEIAEAGGIIESSLFTSGKKAGLSDAMVMNLAGIFAWDIDFVLDIRKGDRFVVIYEKLYRDGEFLRDGRILAATFINQGERFQAVWFEDGDLAGYYAPDGRNMRKAFLRAPLNFAYISSGFNPKRMHPVLKRVRPHNGIDYYAPKGTPVYAAGDGTVIRSGYSAANGNHVFIRHANGIETKYLHFSKTAVKNGQHVKQGQTIGYVGSTGLATGPHLHYEFVVNGVHRNPRTVPLPKVEPLQGAALGAFQSRAAPMLTQLSRMESASLYASIK